MAGAQGIVWEKWEVTHRGSRRIFFFFKPRTLRNTYLKCYWAHPQDICFRQLEAEPEKPPSIKKEGRRLGKKQRKEEGDFPGGPVGKIHASNAGAWVWFLVEELRSHMLCSAMKKKKAKERREERRGEGTPAKMMQEVKMKSAWGWVTGRGVELTLKFCTNWELT